MIYLLTAVGVACLIVAAFYLGRDWERTQHELEEMRKHEAAKRASLTCDKVAHIRDINPHGDRRQRH